MAFRSANSNIATAATSVVVTAPAGIQDGDILLFVCGANAETPGLPAGVTQIAVYTAATTDCIVGWKRAASESGNYTFTVSGTNDYLLAAVACYSGRVYSGDPVNTYSNTDYTTSNTTIRGGSVTTTKDGCDIVWLGGGPGAHTMSVAPPGTTLRTSTADSPGYIYVYDLLNQAAGATGNLDGTLEAAADDKHAFVVAIASVEILGTGAVQVAAATLAGTGHYDIIGTGAVQIGAAALAGTGHYDITGTGALTIGSPTLSGSIWMNSADLRHVAGRAWLYGVSGKAEIYGLLGKAEM